MELTAGVSTEFLERILKRKVIDFEVSEVDPSFLGDGITCSMLSVQVRLEEQQTGGEEEDEAELNLLIKCYPVDNPGRLNYLDMSKYFPTELGAYDTLIPELEDFQEQYKDGDDELVGDLLPFPKFYYGHYIEPKKRKDKPLKPMDNCIVLQDLRSHGQFRLRDKFLGLDLDHYKLVIETQAKLHALSWAYKYKKGLEFLWERFPFLKMVLHEDMMTMLEIRDKEAHQTCSNIVQDDYEAVRGLKHMLSVAPSVVSLYFLMCEECTSTKAKKAPPPSDASEAAVTKDSVLKQPQPSVENEVLWTVVCHGDCSTSNMLFRYDTVTGKPVQVRFIDLQLTREGDPFTDVTYALYFGTTREFRRKHLSSMLHLYYDTFTQVCSAFSVPCFPGWSWEEFNRRFHRAKLYGAGALKSLPTFLKAEIDLVDVEQVQPRGSSPRNHKDFDEDEDSQFVLSLNKFEITHPALRERLTGGLLELVEEGVI